MARRRMVAPQLGIGLEAARERDVAAAWYVMHDAMKDELCKLAGVPDASAKGVAMLTQRERVAIVVALRDPIIRTLVPDGLCWGLEQMADVPRYYRVGA
jgi:hypothetical protein